jgi:hypothetical protein
VTESASSGEIVLYRREDGTPAIEVRLENETVWLSLNQLAELFQRDKSTISRHIANVFAEGELARESVVAVRATTAADGKTYQVEYFNLDVIISVGYRVTSAIATRFRMWATERLREYLVKGFTMDDARLKELGGGRYWRELLERIREIRSSEKVLYRQVLDLYATSVDYDPTTAETTRFFQIVQNKLHFAAHGHTAAEVIAQRADAAEFRAQRHEPTYMADWIAHLDRLLAAMDAPVLNGAGSVSSQSARARAEQEYETYRRRRDAEPTDTERAYLQAIKDAQRHIEGNQP